LQARCEQVKRQVDEIMQAIGQWQVMRDDIKAGKKRIWYIKTLERKIEEANSITIPDLERKLIDYRQG
jgi:hypothetical protein